MEAKPIGKKQRNPKENGILWLKPYQKKMTGKTKKNDYEQGKKKGNITGNVDI